MQYKVKRCFCPVSLQRHMGDVTQLQFNKKKHNCPTQPTIHSPHPRNLEATFKEPRKLIFQKSYLPNMIAICIYNINHNILE